MKKRRIFAFIYGIVITFILVAGLQLIASSFLGAKSDTNLIVCASASLRESLEEVKSLYQNTKSNVNITYNFGDSGALPQQNENGISEDIWVSAAQKQMDALPSKDLILPATRRKLLKNSLVLIVPRNSSGINSFRQLIASKVKRIAIGDPKSVPEGQYAQEVFRNLGILPQIRSKFILGNNVRQVLAAVERENANAGVVYSTDAKTSKQVKVVAIASERLHAPVVYSAAVLKKSKNLSAAKDYLQFLSSNQAKPVFEKHGFSMAR